ncbi:MAG TPA: hypothetical protein VE715_13630 [Blastocatellia bacterium]|nr:hypothetical protein [Blastocatellia bacterium]
MNKKQLFQCLIALLFAVSFVYARENVKLTGYVVDVKCAAEHAKDRPEGAMKFAAEHTRECALKEECVKSGYGVYADGKWYPFDTKGNELAKALLEKTRKKDHVKVSVTGIKRGGKILVQQLTEVE